MFNINNIQDNRDNHLSEVNFDNNSTLLNTILEFLIRAGWGGEDREVLEAIPHFKEKLEVEDVKYILRNLNYSCNVIKSDIESLESQLFPCFHVADDQVLLLYIENGIIHQYDGLTSRVAVQRAGEFLIFKFNSDSDYNKSIWHEILKVSKQKILKITAIGFCANIFTLALPIYIVSVFTQVVVAKTSGVLIMFFIGYALSVFAGYYINRIKSSLIDNVVDKINKDVGMGIFANVLNLPLQMLTKRPAKEQIKKIQSLEGDLGIALAKTLDYATELPFLIFLIIALGAILNSLFVIVSGYTLALILINYYYNKHTKYNNHENNDIIEDKSSFLTGYLDQYQHLREMNLQKVMRKKLDTIEGEYHYYRMVNNNNFNILTNICQLVMMLSVVAVIGASAHSIVNDGLSPLMLIIMTLLSWRIFSSIKNIIDIGPSVRKLSMAIKQADQLWRMHKDLETKDNNKCINEELQITFQNVNCRDDIKDRKLINANFSFPAHSSVNLVELNNQTNFLFCDLLMRMLDSYSGKILIGERTIKQISTHYLRSKIGFVDDINHIIYGTVRQNILLSSPSASKEDLARVVIDLNLHKDIDLNEKIGDLSVHKLNEGVKQKIFLARALIKKAPLLLLKEPFNGLSASDRVLVENTLAKYKKYGTVIIATNEPVVSSFVDKYLFAHNGMFQMDCEYADLFNMEEEAAT